MKKIILFFIGLFVLTSCNNNDDKIVTNLAKQELVGHTYVDENSAHNHYITFFADKAVFNIQKADTTELIQKIQAGNRIVYSKYPWVKYGGDTTIVINNWELKQKTTIVYQIQNIKVINEGNGKLNVNGCHFIK